MVIAAAAPGPGGVSVPILGGLGGIVLSCFVRGHFDVTVSFSTYGLWSASSVDLGMLTLVSERQRRGTVIH